MTLSPAGGPFFGLSFFLFLCGSSCCTEGIGDCWDLLPWARLRFVRGGRSSSVDVESPPFLPSVMSPRAFSAAGPRRALSCSITFSTFTVAVWIFLCESCLDVRLRFRGVTATGSSGMDHPGTSKSAMGKSNCGGGGCVYSRAMKREVPFRFGFEFCHCSVTGHCGMRSLSLSLSLTKSPAIAVTVLTTAHNTYN